MEQTPLAKLGTGEREQSVTLLRRLAAIVTALTVALIFLPIVTRGRLPRGPGLGRRTTFFAAIGVAFMFVEIPLVQRLTHLLGASKLRDDDRARSPASWSWGRG